MNDRLQGSSSYNPVFYRSFNISLSDPIAPASMAWEYCHEDYDGAPDSNDSRYGHCASIQACKDEIDEWYLEQDEVFLSKLINDKLASNAACKQDLN